MEIIEIYVMGVAAVLGMAASFCAGMYFCTQIDCWIKRRINNGKNEKHLHSNEK
tara:strand:- start:437 stop:598 length:162 start_codon:yes stop_codon:yes gene_type:complete